MFTFFFYFRELIHDQDFTNAIIEMEKEPVPYYGMLTPDLIPLKDETISSLFTVGSFIADVFLSVFFFRQNIEKNTEKFQ